ncbi:MAG: hypothetical protein AB9M60_08575 [Leptothrix sp. (in: b-proteobacteria)]
MTPMRLPLPTETPANPAASPSADAAANNWPSPHASWLLVAALSLAGCADLGAGHAAPGAGADPAAAPADLRQAVSYPAPLKAHTLANMRDHLQALAEIQDALATGRAEQAGQIAEQRLGLGSLKSHGAHEVSTFMPPGMQAAGLAMHRSASRFALEAQNSAATGDLRPALAALTTVTQACVACHARYKLD